MSSAFGFRSDDISSIGTSTHGSISFDSAGIFPRASGRPQEDIVRRILDDDVANQDERLYSLPKLQPKREIGIKFPGIPSLRTTGSSDSNTALENPVREAITNLRAIVKLTESGVVSAGTLEGFVERLTTSFSAPFLNLSTSTPLIFFEDLPQDIEFVDTLLMACTDFTTPEDFFGVLSRRFYEGELSNMHPEMRVAMQFKHVLIPCFLFILK
jgi:son of sevenless-like protein